MAKLFLGWMKEQRTIKFYIISILTSPWHKLAHVSGKKFYFVTLYSFFILIFQMFSSLGYLPEQFHENGHAHWRKWEAACQIWEVKFISWIYTFMSHFLYAFYRVLDLLTDRLTEFKVRRPISSWDLGHLIFNNFFRLLFPQRSWTSPIK